MKRNKRAAKAAEESVIASPSSPAPEPAAEPAAGIDKMTLLCLDPAKPAEVRPKLLLDGLRQNEAEEPRNVPHRSVQAYRCRPEAQVAQMKEHYEQALLELNEGRGRPRSSAW